MTRPGGKSGCGCALSAKGSSRVAGGFVPVGTGSAGPCVHGLARPSAACPATQGGRDFAGAEVNINNCTTREDLAARARRELDARRQKGELPPAWQDKHSRPANATVRERSPGRSPERKQTELTPVSQPAPLSNPSWRKRPADVQSHIAAEICVTEVEGNWLRPYWLRAEDAMFWLEVA